MLVEKLRLVIRAAVERLDLHHRRMNVLRENRRQHAYAGRRQDHRRAERLQQIAPGNSCNQTLPFLISSARYSDVRHAIGHDGQGDVLIGIAAEGRGVGDKQILHFMRLAVTVEHATSSDRRP